MPRRVRKHSNPFHLRVELGRLDRAALFGREGPLEVELGAGSGSFLLERAKNHPELDFVGLEVRAPIVEKATAVAQSVGQRNVVYLHANANMNVAKLAEPGVIVRFHVHFPDPWFKKRHMKRRMMKPALVRDMAELLPIGGEVYAQSDLEPLALEMHAILAAERAFEGQLDPSMRVARPVLETTEWERHHEVRGEPIFRMLFRKVRAPEGPIPSVIPRRPI